jgi:hypothetical protein
MKYDESLSSFAFKFDLRRYTAVTADVERRERAHVGMVGRCWLTPG